MAKWQLKPAVDALTQGEIIAYPTEAVYGLGCDPWNELALRKLLKIKHRPWQKGLILIAADIEQLYPFIAPLSDDKLKLLSQELPEPTTWLLPVSAHISPYLTGEHNTIAVRVTTHQQTADLCRAFGGALVSTSANRSGKKPATTQREIRFHLPEIDTVLSGSCPATAQVSTIRDLQSGKTLR